MAKMFEQLKGEIAQLKEGLETEIQRNVEMEVESNINLL